MKVGLTVVEVRQAFKTNYNKLEDRVVSDKDLPHTYVEFEVYEQPGVEVHDLGTIELKFTGITSEYELGKRYTLNIEREQD